MKKIISLILSLVFLFGTFSFGLSAQAVSTVKKTMLQYTYVNLTFKKPESASYKCSVSNNKDKYISVDAYNEGDHYWLTVRSKKPTNSKKKPVITVYKQNKDGKKTDIKKYSITVNPAKKVKMSNIKINTGTSKRITLKNPYYECKDYNLTYNKKILKITQYLFDGEKAIYTFKGLKKGKTTVKAYLSGTKKLIGSFTVTVGDFKAGIKDSKKNITIYYNSHMSDSRNLEKGYFDLGKAISNYHTNSVYSVKAENTKLIGTGKNHTDEITPKADLVYSKKTGKTKLTVYEKRGNNKKKKIGTITLTIKKAKDSAVYASNCELDNDGIFYEFFICPGDTVNLKSIVVNRYLNTSRSHFKNSEYTFTAKSKYPNTITVDKNGVCTCHGFGKNEVTYTITFKDGSKVTGGGSFNIVDEDFF